MNVQTFWQVIEASWAYSPKLNQRRAKALKTNDGELLEELSQDLTETILGNYKSQLAKLDKSELTAFIHILEEKLYTIDREEVHEFTDGSDDGFLYCRCFIVGMGQQYYEMINNNPSKATMDVEAELFGFEAYSVYENLFNEEFERDTIHCIESGSNKAAWSY